MRSSSSSFLPRFYLFFALLLLLLSPLFLAHFISYFAFATRAHSLVLQNIFHRFFIQRKILFKFSGIFSPFLGFPSQRERNTNKNNNREQPPLSCKRERIETRRTHTQKKEVNEEWKHQSKSRETQRTEARADERRAEREPNRLRRKLKVD